MPRNDDLWRLPSILTVDKLEYPYLYKFPGQESREQILYVMRESKIILNARRVGAVVVGILIVIMAWVIGKWLGDNWLIGSNWQVWVGMITALVTVSVALAWWWLTFNWKRTLGILTTYRLIKMVQINPFTNRNQMLPLREVVDTSSGTRSFWEMMWKLSTFTARSSATSSGIATNDAEVGKLRINKKYFFLENIENAEDFENYVHKVMKLLDEKGSEGMYNFRPFAPKLKAGRRDEIKKQYPEYWS